MGVAAGRVKKVMRIGQKYLKERFLGKYMALLIAVVYGVSSMTVSSSICIRKQI
jgi:hypothetical protein